MSCNEKMKKYRAAWCVAFVMAPGMALAGGMSANRTALMPGETLEVTYQADAATGNDVYFAGLVDGKVFFADSSGGFTPYTAGAATPARLSKPVAGTYKMLTYTVPQNFNYDISFVLVEAKPGADLLASADGVNYDIDSRRSKIVTFMERPTELDFSSASASKGATLYQQNCFACHNDPKLNLGYIQRGIDPKKTLVKIANINPMKYLKTLSSNDAIDIAAWLATAR